MAVENRFVVIRNGVEVQTFVDKKEADEHDRMLDIADLVAELLDTAPVTLTDGQKEELSIYLAKQRERLLLALQLKKAKPAVGGKPAVMKGLQLADADLADGSVPLS